MKKLILFFSLLTVVAVQAQKEKGEAYINTYKEIAIAEMIRSGVPASITLAQGILESQYGESELVKSSNNHFGIKCKTEWTGPKVYHDDDEKGECFRVYATPEESFRDHSDFLKTRPHYAFLFKLDPTDYDGWAKGLKKAGYATLPTYPQRLMKIINDYNLQQYSLEALARIKNPPVTPVIESTAALVKETALEPNKIALDAKDTTAQPSEPIAKAIETETAKQAVLTDSLVKNTAIEPGTVAKKTYPAGVFTINHTKVIYANEGISLLSLANQYDISLSKLIEFNDLPEMDILDTDRLLFIEKKMKKGAGDFHIVTTGETLHDVSQVEGVRLESLAEYNRLSKNATVKPGDKLFLHPIATASVKAPK